jgi:membrane-associated phospholipid phosphatase
MKALGLIAAIAAFCTVAPERAWAQPEVGQHASIFELNVPVDATVIGASVALAIVPPVFGDSIVSPSCPCNPSSVNAIDRRSIGNASSAAATLSDLTTIAAIAAPVGYELATLGLSRAFVEDMVVFGQTVLVSNALVSVVKLAVQRPRPETYATTNRAKLEATDGYLSFYSGHTTNTFAALSAAAMILHLRYDTGVWPWVVTAMVGGSVAIERVLAGKHFPTDVAVGAVAGVGEGVLIPYLHVKHPNEANYGLMLLPIPHGAQLVFERSL